MHPFEEGFEAGLRGDDPRTCPYPKMTREWREWQAWHRYGVQAAGYETMTDEEEDR